MKNYIGPESPVTVTSAADFTSGVFTIVKGLMGVAGCSGVSGDPLPLHTEGVFSLPKTTSEAWVIGQALFWNTSTSKFTTDNTKLPVAARAAAAAGSSATTGYVLLGDPPLRIVAGLATTVAASDTIVTGLAALVCVVAQLNDAPTDALSFVNADIGDQAGTPAAGSFLLKTWKNTSGTDPTPLAATAFGAKVAWIAYGYL